MLGHNENKKLEGSQFNFWGRVSLKHVPPVVQIAKYGFNDGVIIHINKIKICDADVIFPW